MLTPDEEHVILLMRKVSYGTFHVEKKNGHLVRVVTERSDIVPQEIIPKTATTHEVS